MCGRAVLVLAPILFKLFSLTAQLYKLDIAHQALTRQAQSQAEFTSQLLADGSKDKKKGGKTEEKTTSNDTAAELPDVPAPSDDGVVKESTGMRKRGKAD